ncbi:MAG: transposase [Candidatus Tectomicrobia bacterium]|uniref:Mutator family transposase n=1 Tax=Tectimicrobiota bacterium TaxID=2528274 RepID=A0A932I402_UNCTE|nr:transposase [Candidatus Tectomicrobia bacterium]
MEGRKRLLGFVQSDTENSQVLAPFLRGLLERGLDISRGVLVVVDGGKGLRKAVEAAFNRGARRALVQRCQWHKRENVVRPLPKGEQRTWRGRLARAWERPTYGEARSAVLELHGELEERNLSAAGSLEEGFEETLTLHRLGVFALLGRSLKTTNVIESVLSQVEGHCAKVDAWRNSGQKHRWLAASLLDTEPRLRRIKGYRHLPKLREALQRELKIEDEGKASREAA